SILSCAQPSTARTTPHITIHICTCGCDTAERTRCIVLGRLRRHSPVAKLSRWAEPKRSGVDGAGTLALGCSRDMARIATLAPACFAALLSSQFARSDGGPTAQSGATRAERLDDADSKSDARERFSRGLELYAQAKYEAARRELEGAYELAPH